MQCSAVHYTTLHYSTVQYTYIYTTIVYYVIILAQAGTWIQVVMYMYLLFCDLFCLYYCTLASRLGLYEWPYLVLIFCSIFFFLQIDNHDYSQKSLAEARLALSMNIPLIRLTVLRRHQDYGKLHMYIWYVQVDAVKYMYFTCTPCTCTWSTCTLKSCVTYCTR